MFLFGSPPNPTLTEDGIPIRKVYVRKFPLRTQEHELEKLFRRFGKVTKCFIHTGGNIPYAFITFADEKSALKAMTCSVFHRGVRLHVSAADSWHQPPLVAVSERKDTLNEHTTEPETQIENIACTSTNCISESEDAAMVSGNILGTLNDDCILQIMSYLNLRELLRTERVSKKWQELVAIQLKHFQVFKTSCWTAKYNRALTTNVLRTILVKLGKHLRTLHIDNEWASLNDRTPAIIGKFCPNLRELLISRIKTKCWKSLFVNCVTLKVLTFISCANVTDYSFKFLRHELEELSIENSEIITGKFLLHLKTDKLKKLALIGCKNIAGFLLIRGIKRTPNLSRLTLDSCSVSICAELGNVLDTLPKLSEFSFSENMYFTPHVVGIVDTFSRLGNLRALCLSNNCLVTDDFIKSIARGCPQLVALDISGNKDRNGLIGLTDDGVAHVWKLKMLEVLSMSSLCVGAEALKEAGVNGAGSQLRTLICRHNSLMTNEALIRLVQMCPSIVLIDACNCLQIDIEFARKAKESIKLNPDKRKKLTVHIGNQSSSHSTQAALKSLNTDLFEVKTFNDIYDSELKFRGPIYLNGYDLADLCHSFRGDMEDYEVDFFNNFDYMEGDDDLDYDYDDYDDFDDEQDDDFVVNVMINQMMV